MKTRNPNVTVFASLIEAVKAAPEKGPYSIIEDSRGYFKQDETGLTPNPEFKPCYFLTVGKGCEPGMIRWFETVHFWREK